MRAAENIIWVRAMYNVKEIVKGVYRELVGLGYKPVVVGTYALIIQGWLPLPYLDETKDIDIYVDEPMIVFDNRVEERITALGLSVGRTESGGFYVDAGKPIEILYPIHDFYIPGALLRHTVTIDDMEVLEGHAVLVAKALASSIEYLADTIRVRGIRVNTERLRDLIQSIADEVEPTRYRIAERRIESFIKKLYTHTKGEG